MILFVHYVIFNINKDGNALRGERIDTAEMLFLIMLSFLVSDSLQDFPETVRHTIEQAGDTLWNKNFTT